MTTAHYSGNSRSGREIFVKPGMSVNRTTKRVKLQGSNKMLKKALPGVSFIAAAMISATTMGEDAVTADPEHYTVEFENDRVRVIRIK